MGSPTLINSRHQTYPVLACQSRLLIVSDSAERLTRLRASLAVGEVEIAGVSSPEVMCSACRGGYDLIVVDVSHESISGVLNVLRGCKGCAKIPVLVEASRLTADLRLAGLLPQYRAMPCTQTDMVALARRRIAPNSEERRARGIL
jgi:PleD family two-component response regulator